ncbi:translation initiation factor IF-6, partial [Candidatus Micrarchaeota archaeon]|nr:translation initiation factor IF-6 [Candidatus Micrarchaeota archaeon]
MKVKKKTIKGSPFIGVFASVTEKIGLFPLQLEEKEIKKMEEFFEIEIIQTSIAGSSLIGSFVKGNSKGFVVPETVEEREMDFLKEQGIKVKKINGLTALGNLIALNDFGGIISPLVEKNNFNEIKKFFGVPFMHKVVANSEVVGSCVVATNKGFVLHPEIKEKE